VVGLVGVLLSVTLILAPVGIPLLFLARKLFGYSMTFFLPRVVRHPAQELRDKGSAGVSDALDSVGLNTKGLTRARKRGRKTSKKAGKKAGKKVRKALSRQAKRVA
jgi:hypothetical protein